MSVVDIATSYVEALRVIREARIDVVSAGTSHDPIWDKLYRVTKYVERRLSDELAEVLA